MHVAALVILPICLTHLRLLQLKQQLRTLNSCHLFCHRRLQKLEHNGSGAALYGNMIFGEQLLLWDYQYHRCSLMPTAAA